jgi:hypothetical protein
MMTDKEVGQLWRDWLQEPEYDDRRKWLIGLICKLIQERANVAHLLAFSGTWQGHSDFCSRPCIQEACRQLGVNFAEYEKAKR